MTDLTDHAKSLLGRALCGRQPALPTQVFLGLGTGGGDATGVVGEPAGSGYARQRVTFGGGATQTNSATVRFTFTAAVGTLTHVGLFDAASGGNALTWGPLAPSAAVTGPGTITVSAGGLSIASS
jgi:hypothetical protein